VLFNEMVLDIYVLGSVMILVINGICN